MSDFADSFNPDATDKLAESLGELNEKIDEYTRKAEGAAAQGEAMAEALTGLAGEAKALEGKGATLATQFGEVAAGFASTLTPTSLLANAANKLYDSFVALVGMQFDMLKAQDEMLTQFNKNTAATSVYGQELVNLERSMFNAGVSTADAAETMTSLVSEVKNLSTLTPTARTDLAETAAVLNELGVSSDTTAESFQFLNAAMGMTAQESTEFSRTMFRVAQDLALPPAEMAQAFNAASGDLAAFGDEAGEVFLDLQTNARAASMEVNDLLSITQQFDTFEGAADSVGRLNAILGGPFLNSMQMVQTTDPTERMKLLSDAISSAGLSFEEMGYYQRIALAEAGGFKDVEELALVMKGGFDESATSIAGNQKSLESLKAAQQDFITLGEQMTQMLGYFVLSFRPVIQILSFAIKQVNRLLDWISQLGQFALPGLAAILITVAFLLTALALNSTAATAAAGMLSSALATVASTAAAAAAPLTAAGGAAGAAGAAASPAIPVILALAAGFLALGLAALAAGAGVLLIGKGLKLIFDSLFQGGLDGMVALNQLAGSLTALTIASLGLGLAIGPLSSLAQVINSLDENKIIPLASLFESVNSILDKDMTNLLTMEKSIKGIVKSINSIDDTSKVMEVRKLIQQINSSAAGGQASSTTAGASGANPLSQPLNVKLKMDGREMGTWAYNTVADFLNMGRSN